MKNKIRKMKMKHEKEITATHKTVVKVGRCWVGIRMKGSFYSWSPPPDVVVDTIDVCVSV